MSLWLLLACNDYILLLQELPRHPLGVFFSTVTLIVAMSTTFTVCVLNLRYRQHANHRFPPTVCTYRSVIVAVMASLTIRSQIHYVFIEFIPWLMLMKRPGYRFSCARSLDEQTMELESTCVQVRRLRHRLGLVRRQLQGVIFSAHHATGAIRCWIAARRPTAETRTSFTRR